MSGQPKSLRRSVGQDASLAESGGRRSLRVREHALDDRMIDRPVLEAADHLSFADDVLELHQTRR